MKWFVNTQMLGSCTGTAENAIRNRQVPCWVMKRRGRWGGGETGWVDLAGKVWNLRHWHSLHPIPLLDLIQPHGLSRLNRLFGLGFPHGMGTNIPTSQGDLLPAKFPHGLQYSLCWCRSISTGKFALDQVMMKKNPWTLVRICFTVSLTFKRYKGIYILELGEGSLGHFSFKHSSYFCIWNQCFQELASVSRRLQEEILDILLRPSRISNGCPASRTSILPGLAAVKQP